MELPLLPSKLVQARKMTTAVKFENGKKDVSCSNTV
jgi:hypothetical protein